MEASVDPDFYFNVYSAVSSLSFCNDPSVNSNGKQTMILIGTINGKVLQWNLKSRKQICDIEYSLEHSKNPILCLRTLLTDSKELLLVIQERFSNVIYILKNVNGSWHRLKSLQLAKQHVGFCKADSLLDKLLAFPSGENSFEVAKVKNNGAATDFQLVSPVTEFEGCGTITALKFSVIGERQILFSLFENGDLYVHNVDTINEKCSLQLLSKHQSIPMTPLTMCYDSDKLKGVIGGSEDFIWSFELRENHDQIEFHLEKKRQISTKGISSLVIRPDKKIIVAGSWDSTLKLFSWLHPKKLKPLGALKFHSEGIEIVAATNDSKLIAAGSKDGKISFWNVY